MAGERSCRRERELRRRRERDENGRTAFGLRERSTENNERETVTRERREKDRSEEISGDRHGDYDAGEKIGTEIAIASNRRVAARGRMRLGGDRRRRRGDPGTWFMLAF